MADMAPQYPASVAGPWRPALDAGHDLFAPSQSGKKIMDQLRVLVAEGQAEEAQLLEGRIATYENDTRKTFQSVLLGGGLGALALLLLIRIRWELTSRRRAETASHAREQRYRSLFNPLDEGVA